MLAATMNGVQSQIVNLTLFGGCLQFPAGTRLRAVEQWRCSPGYPSISVLRVRVESDSPRSVPGFVGDLITLPKTDCL
jgi:hypothetical protein